MSDNVNHPDHYNCYKIEVIDLVEKCDFCIGNVIKYILRAPFKGKCKEDLRKARWYLVRAQENNYGFASIDCIDLCRQIGNNIVTDIINTVIIFNLHGTDVLDFSFAIEKIDSIIKSSDDEK